MAYKVIYNRNNCIGANSCVGVLPEFWSLDETKKAVLKGSLHNQNADQYELMIEDHELERFKESALVCPVYVIDIIDMNTQKSILNLTTENEVEKESAPVIKASHSNNDSWKEDPKGFFAIVPYAEKKIIKVRYYSSKHQLLFIIEGNNASEIYQTIIKEGFLSSLEHAAYLGSELQKAEISMKQSIPYTQDHPL